jgi:hypothetical protein
VSGWTGNCDNRVAGNDGLARAQHPRTTKTQLED